MVGEGKHSGIKMHVVNVRNARKRGRNNKKEGVGTADSGKVKNIKEGEGKEGKGTAYVGKGKNRKQREGKEQEGNEIDANAQVKAGEKRKSPPINVRGKGKKGGEQGGKKKKNEENARREEEAEAANVSKDETIIGESSSSLMHA